ncbi:hypothetical protein L249_3977 [Ophiocordyceps polyrhachis-furcata BCC 54312]|uniref:non-specific serine/threonine protein kinase n=1 Tax=Ophiocordyceps polyrhachis-furcata BCC 54312 TaxID=1330021 RepID=A0A367L5J3_9HYPO|nr:hypothetical protein L249_3977 [Ophiocordyceps polyrhachis-furcata BCC 54312]
MSSAVPDYEVVEYHYYYPRGVLDILASGTSAFIGEVNDSTILKYPLEQGGDLSRIEHEYKLLKIIGPHERIIAITEQGLTNDGLYLERASNGTLLDFMSESREHALSLRKRIAWCREVVEAVAYVHSKNVIHCDINPANILLDDKLHIRLADFQGCHLGDSGEELLPALVGEPCRYFCPRNEDSGASRKTDIFALGSTIHFIVTGEEVFPDIIAGEEDWDERVRSRFASRAFPDNSHPCASITRKCWMQQYMSASEVLGDVKKVEQLNGWV